MRITFTILIFLQILYVSFDGVGLFERLYNFSFFGCMVLLSFSFGIKYGKQGGIENKLFAAFANLIGTVYTSWAILEVVYIFKENNKTLPTIDLLTVVLFGLIIYSMVYFILFKSNKKLLL